MECATSQYVYELAKWSVGYYVAIIIGLGILLAIIIIMWVHLNTKLNYKKR